MFELVVLFVGAMPFLIGIYALTMIRRGRAGDGDDAPPPPDPGPPRPVIPPTPCPRRACRPTRAAPRSSISHHRLDQAGWRHRVRF